MYWTDYFEDVIYRANLTTGEDRVAVVSEHLPEPGEIGRNRERERERGEVERGGSEREHRKSSGSCL